MAPRERVVPEIYHGRYGHSFYYSFILHDLGVIGSWTFREDFKIECRLCPSSWLCEMVFQRVSDSGEVSIPITLRRTDFASNAVKIRIEPYIDDEVTDREFFFDKPAIEKEGIRGGGVMKETVLKNLPSSEQRNRYNRKLYVKLFIYVSSCH
ncbi:hypothetical protein AVEN_171332-1 [Araneus ventricosus]|uniref:Uncharacterized protein n=1 Tax=Araneus ventricosus TaxID=182803 RepID=A0A4Y2M5N0_ARAVE|nr:hypothetical protein AVEN_171332-1 [Araneus ventricosus]